MSLISTAKGFMKWFVPPLLTRIAGFHTSTTDIGAVEYVVGQANSYQDGTANATANAIYWVPFTAPDSPSSLSRLAVHLTAAGTGAARIKLALAQSSDHDLRFGGEVPIPGKILAQSGEIDASGTGLKTYSPGTPVPLTPGRVYWFALVANETMTYRAYSSFVSVPLGFAIPALTNLTSYYFDSLTTYANAHGPYAAPCNGAQATFPVVLMRYILV